VVDAGAMLSVNAVVDPLPLKVSVVNDVVSIGLPKYAIYSFGYFALTARQSAMYLSICA
jgi:hypothetical protein